ncbi:MAG: hypothetical protein ISN29_01955 [Gammaproteobacteria bacterium AqS3]|nr:hypothetical protein [Gammaproteobacteria bacterium AqS3]
MAAVKLFADIFQKTDSAIFVQYRKYRVNDFIQTNNVDIKAGRPFLFCDRFNFFSVARLDACT